MFIIIAINKFFIRYIVDMNRFGKILFGGLRSLSDELGKEEWRDARFTILLDENIFQHCLPLLIAHVEALQEAEFIEVPAGEECKSLEVAAQVWQTLLEGGADRRHVIVNRGGGSVCDLGGFVAAGYKRGIRHIQVPTSLLAMVDAAIGGKTAVDFGGVKNSIGHFYPASLICIEPDFLETLPQEELVNGRMEMVKTAAVADSMMFRRFIDSDKALEIAKQDMVTVARIKNRIAKVDPCDQGIRKILNFGHTFGHAIEVYRQLPHGLAVGVGMRVAMYLSVKKLGLAEEVYATYSQWLEDELSAIRHPSATYNLKDIEQMLPLMHQDKKNADGQVRCVLLQEPGAAVIDVTVSDNEIRDAFLHL